VWSGAELFLLLRPELPVHDGIATLGFGPAGRSPSPPAQIAGKGERVALPDKS
jgi:hypothetical protein